MTMSFLRPGPLDVIDILIASYIIYRILLLFQGTRAAQMLFGLLLLLLTGIVAQWFHLNALQTMISGLEAVWVIGFIIVFQPELRRALAELGKTRLFRFLVEEEEEAEFVEEIEDTAIKLSTSKLGGLIAIEREVSLKGFLEGGTRIEAKVSSELLTTIFSPYTPLHDGAVIIRKNLIVAAGCILPLTQNPLLDRNLGTRHRAAVGLTEETDAVVVVVSEESRSISLAVGGNLERDLEPARLRDRLYKLTIKGRRPQA
jgi:diadenylate cyclase